MIDCRVDFVKEFGDILASNEQYDRELNDSELTGVARKGLAVVTCMDSRIDPLALFGKVPGDVKILRRAGARVTDDVLRTLILANYLLGVNRVLVVSYTDRRMTFAAEEEMYATVFEASGINSRGIEIASVSDQLAALVLDTTRVRAHPLLSKTLAVGGAIFGVHTGRLIHQDI